jgi:hypothetical protein
MSDQSFSVNSDRIGQVAGRDIRNEHHWDARSIHQVLRFGAGGRECPTDPRDLPAGTPPGCGAALKKTSVVFGETSLGFMARNNMGMLARPPVEPKTPPGVKHPGKRPADAPSGREKAIARLGGLVVAALAWMVADFTDTWPQGLFVPLMLLGWFMTARLVYYGEWGDRPAMSVTVLLCGGGATLQLASLPPALTGVLLGTAWAVGLTLAYRSAAAYEVRVYDDNSLRYREHQDALALYRRNKATWTNSWICTACGRKWEFVAPGT